MGAMLSRAYQDQPGSTPPARSGSGSRRIVVATQDDGLSVLVLSDTHHIHQKHQSTGASGEYGDIGVCGVYGDTWSPQDIGGEPFRALPADLTLALELGELLGNVARVFIEIARELSKGRFAVQVVQRL